MHFLLTSRGRDSSLAYSDANVTCPTAVTEWKYWDSNANAWQKGGVNLVVSECSPRIEVLGGGAAKQTHSGIFTTYTIEPDLMNGRVHYTSLDGTKAIAFGGNGVWYIQPVANR